jgi:acyl carrier protein
MTKDELRSVVLQQLAHVAPDADLSTLEPDADLRDAFDLDSMDFLRFATGLSTAFHRDVPESAYPRIASLRGCMDYFSASSAANSGA